MMVAAKELSAVVGVAPACAALAMPRASFYRWLEPAAEETQLRPTPARALSVDERRTVRDVLNSEEFVDDAPAQVYATLLDRGIYLCSVRSMYRILDEHGEVKERRDQLRHPEYTKPELLATGPNQVWSWDITKLLGPAKWTYYYLYVILDIFSRLVVGWLLAERESATLAKRLIEETIEKQGIVEDELTLHSDRGSSMKSKAVAQLLAELGVTKSHSRPHTSNDNPFSESQFKTLKYRPEFPKRFGSIEDALVFCRGFFAWYNEEHHHSAIGYMTPEEVHYGRATALYEQRHATLLEAYRRHPERFVRKPPQPSQLAGAVWINPPADRAAPDQVVGSARRGSERDALAGEPAPGARELVPPLGRSPREDPRERSELRDVSPSIRGDWLAEPAPSERLSPASAEAGRLT